MSLPGLPWSPEFMAALAAAVAAYKAPAGSPIGASRTMAGSVDEAIVGYYQNRIKELAPSTQVSQRGLMERFRKECGDLRLKGIDQARVQRYVSSLGSAAVQRNMLRALRHFLKYCNDKGLIGHDPSQGVRRKKMKQTGGFMVWTEDHVSKFEERHPIGSTARLALALYLNLGVRKSDVVRIGPRNVRDGVLTDFQPQKTSHSNGKLINVPLTAETRAILAATPITGTETYLLNSFGKSFTANGFGNKMREWCDQAGLPECSSHGLRKLCLTRLANIDGMDVLDLAAISGHKDLRELQIYIDAADRKRRAKRAIAKMEAAQIMTGD